MSLPTRNNLMYVVVDSTDEEIIDSVKCCLQNHFPTISMSPTREQASLVNCVEFYCTLPIIDEDIPWLNAYWNSDMEYFEDYGFNTKMFHEHVYYLRIDE